MAWLLAAVQKVLRAVNGNHFSNVFPQISTRSAPFFYQAAPLKKRQVKKNTRHTASTLMSLVFSPRAVSELSRTRCLPLVPQRFESQTHPVLIPAAFFILFIYFKDTVFRPLAECMECFSSLRFLMMDCVTSKVISLWSVGSGQ